MKSAITFALLTSFTTAALADDASVSATAPAPKTLAVDALGIVPIGDYGEVATLGVGASARLEVPMERGFVTGRFGAIFHAMDDRVGDSSWMMFPAFAGYRYPVHANGTYVAGELGLTYSRFAIETAFGKMSDSSTELGLAVTAGMRRGALDVRGGLFAPSIDDAWGLILSAGYDFAAF